MKIFIQIKNNSTHWNAKLISLSSCLYLYVSLEVINEDKNLKYRLQQLYNEKDYNQNPELYL